MVIDYYVRKYFFRGVLVVFFVVFWIGFGILMFFGILCFLLNGWVSDLYIVLKFYFMYYGFSWVKVFLGNWMYLSFILFLVLFVLIIIGFLYCFVVVLLFVIFMYVELLDKIYYLNYYYFVSIVVFLFILVLVNVDFLVDVKLWGY